ncbi:MAG: LytTR family DNA-binding domain-containing protein [Muribaculaceae bacterium]|nr:LytTR family DNA-binding domain-containing protein [Muribaculaceae bacterium]
MQSIRTIIIDDEPLARRGMQQLVSSRPELQLVGTFPSAAEAEKFMKTNRVDFILLDIEMPGLNGMDFALNTAGEAAIVFTTAYTEYVSESYEVNAVDYLVKPIESARFARAVERVVRALDRIPAERITVKADRRIVNIDVAGIMMVEGVKDYVKLHLADKNVTTRLTIKRMERLLPADTFLRIHKSFIVNISKIESYDGKSVELAGKRLPIGQSYRQGVILRLGQEFPCSNAVESD